MRLESKSFGLASQEREHRGLQLHTHTYRPEVIDPLHKPAEGSFLVLVWFYFLLCLLGNSVQNSVVSFCVLGSWGQTFLTLAIYRNHLALFVLILIVGSRCGRGQRCGMLRPWDGKQVEMRLENGIFKVWSMDPAASATWQPIRNVSSPALPQTY